MRFLDLYEAENNTPETSGTGSQQNQTGGEGQQKPKEQPKSDGKNAEAKPVTMDDILGDLDGIYGDDKKFIAFLNKINRPGQKSDFAFTYGGNAKRHGEGGKSVSYTVDINSKQPSDEFRQIMSRIKDGHDGTWKEKIISCLDHVETAERQQYIRDVFVPKLENPGVKISQRSNRRGDERVPGVEQYTTFGKAMVYYAGVCVSKLTDTDTKISEDKFREIMQGVFGAAPSGMKEDDSFLMQFTELESKMKIDAAKNVINSIHAAGTKDIQGGTSEDDMMSDSYYTALSYLINNKLFEADESEDSDGGSNVACPKSIDEFSNDAATALKQAAAVSKKYPKQYKIWYEKLQAAFDKGVKEYQDLERNPDRMREGIENPITHKIEHRHGRAWGAGGPNAFIRDNPYLDKIVQRIKNGSTPGCEGVNGWDIFNFGPKLILKLFDVLEHGGKIYQKICDDLGEGMRDIKRAFGKANPKDFDTLIKKYSSEKEHGKAMELCLSSILCALTNLYKVLANGKIGQINLETKTYNSENIGSETNIQVKIDDLKNALAKASKEMAVYDKWKVEEDKKREERVQKLEAEIEGLKKQKDNPEAAGEGEAQQGEDQNKNGISVNQPTEPKQESLKKKITLHGILTEEETEQKATSSQEVVKKVEEDLKKKEEELEKEKSGKNDKTLINVKNYIAILDEYKNILSLEPYIKETYDFINLIFDPDAAEEQYQAIFNGEEHSEEESDEESEEGSSEETETPSEEEAEGNAPAPTAESLNSRLNKILSKYYLTEEEGETVNSEELDDDPGSSDSKPAEQSSNDNSKTNTTSEQNKENDKDEPKVKSTNKGNLDWTKRDKANGLKEVYRIFNEGKDDVRLNLETLKDLSDIKKQKDALQKTGKIVENLRKTLDRLNPVEPIVDGIVACNKIENVGDIPGAIEAINPNGLKDDKDENKEEDKDKDKDKENKPDEQKKSTLEVYKEYRENLTKFIDSNSPLMTNIISQLNPEIEKAKDDSWLKEYSVFVESFNKIGNEIFGYFDKIYENSQGGKEFIAKAKKNIEGSTFLLQIWYLVSTVKYAIGQLNNEIEQEEENELKREQRAEQGQQTHESYIDFYNSNILTEADNQRKEHNIVTAVEKMKSTKIDFNTILPTDYTNDIYTLSPEGSKAFNDAEKQIAESGIGTRGAINGIYHIVTDIVRTDSNDVVKYISENNLPCKELIKAFIEAPKNKELQGNDRDIYFIYGIIRGIVVVLDTIKDNELQELDCRDVSPRSGGNENESMYLSGISSDSLMNEIYKYIKGN